MDYADLPDNVKAWVTKINADGHSSSAISMRLVQSGYPQEVIKVILNYLAQWDNQPQNITLNVETSVSQLDHQTTPKLLMTLAEPEIKLYAGFLSDAECDALIASAAGRMKVSNVVNAVTGEYQIHSARTSSTAYFQRAETALISAIEQRIAKLTNTRTSQGEPFQVLNYQSGAQYKPHFDYFDPAQPGNNAILAMGGQRCTTCIIYLNDDVSGGATVFPELKLHFQPKKGHALMFSYITPQGTLDARTLHGGAPVEQGEKWIATKWIRVGNF